MEELAVEAICGKFDSSISENVEHLTSLVISFKEDVDCCIGPPCLCDAIEKMPALTYLKIDGIDDGETVDLTLKAIELALASGKNVAIRPSERGVPKRIFKAQKSEGQAETLKLWIEPQYSNYFDKINKKELKDCRIVDDTFKTFERKKTLLEQYLEIYKCCPQEPQVIGIEEDGSEESDDDDDDDDTDDDDVSAEDNENSDDFEDDSDLSDEEDEEEDFQDELFIRQLVNQFKGPENDEDSDEDSARDPCTIS